jgi:hypothetical protein
VIRVPECQLITSHIVAKSLHELLTEKLKECEAYFVEIPTSEKFESRKEEYLPSKGPDDLESLK